MAGSYFFNFINRKGDLLMSDAAKGKEQANNNANKPPPSTEYVKKGKVIANNDKGNKK